MISFSSLPASLSFSFILIYLLKNCLFDEFEVEIAFFIFQKSCVRCVFKLTMCKLLVFRIKEVYISLLFYINRKIDMGFKLNIFGDIRLMLVCRSELEGSHCAWIWFELKRIGRKEAAI